MGRRKICCAYLNLKAYEYFVKGMATAECIFHYLEKDYAYLKENNRLEEQEEVCRLALLQYYSSQVDSLKETARLCGRDAGRIQHERNAVCVLDAL